MRLIFIRHAEPDYDSDSLTEHGIREAECLNRFLKNIDLGEVYSSPLGRALQTAQIATTGKGTGVYLRRPGRRGADHERIRAVYRQTRAARGMIRARKN